MDIEGLKRAVDNVNPIHGWQYPAITVRCDDLKVLLSLAQSYLDGKLVEPMSEEEIEGEIIDGYNEWLSTSDEIGTCFKAIAKALVGRIPVNREKSIEQMTNHYYETLEEYKAEIERLKSAPSSALPSWEVIKSEISNCICESVGGKIDKQWLNGMANKYADKILAHSASPKVCQCKNPFPNTFNLQSELCSICGKKVIYPEALKDTCCECYWGGYVDGFNMNVPPEKQLATGSIPKEVCPVHKDTRCYCYPLGTGTIPKEDK